MKQSVDESLEALIREVKEKLSSHREIAEVFDRCYRNTMQKTVERLEDGTTYVITGDIPAMWLRDSTAQMRPYLILAAGNEEMADIIEGLIKRQVACIHIDPYANAFNREANGACWEQDKTLRNDWVWERKYEIDSLCYPVQLMYLFWKVTNRTEFFDLSIKKALEKIIQVFRIEQNHEEKSEYSFIRKNTFFTDTLSRGGKGALVKPGIGLTWSGFRPSDDACTYGYLIPSNMFAVVILGYMEEIAEVIYNDTVLMQEANELKREIKAGIENFGITAKEGYGNVYAYEVDGFGQFNLMDDANVPSLLSMEYLGYQPERKEVAENTRKLILSEANPYYYEGSKASGIGSSHTPVGYIWHISLAMEGLTTKDKNKKLSILKKMVKTDGDTEFMHESFNPDNPREYTREWFSWANALFCELVLEYCGYTICNTNPSLKPY